ncbi:MAG: hypothetical protein NTY38_31135 [Acidobacteria bacterium]|nr:hypothetical protein [Acidobacteriota bacterium]
MTPRSVVCLVLFLASQFACAQPGFRAGAGRRDITPKEGVPMWGYGARHDQLSSGVLDPLFADAVVLEAAGRKIALVGLDLGRAPAEASLQRIRGRIRAAGIGYSIIGGSHTHHGPVLELTDQLGKGKLGAILDANGRLEPAKIASGSVQVSGFNRNRHSKREPKISDRELVVLRIDSAAGKPLAVLSNFAAHPTSIDGAVLKFSADYVGGLKDLVRKETGAAAIFLQGACGDQSTDRGGKDHRAFGEALGREVVKLAATLSPQAPEKPALEVREERLKFTSRTNFANPLIKTLFSEAFFPELVENYLDEYAEGVRPRWRC